MTGYSENELSGPGAYDVQGALNVPIIKGVLALRFAGVLEGNHVDLVHSLYLPENPYSRTKSGRVTLTFRPYSGLTATVMYEHLENDDLNFPQVIGPGSAGGTIPPDYSAGYFAPAVVAPGYNGPPITAQQRLSVENAANLATTKIDLVTANVSWRFWGQRLVYDGAYVPLFGNVGSTPQDTGNLLPGNDFSSTSFTTQTQEEHDLRLMSAKPILGLFDYVLGATYGGNIGGPRSTYSRLVNYAGFAPLPLFGLPGAFGPGPAPNPYEFNPSALEPLNIYDAGRVFSRSVYADLTVHLPDRTQVTAGVRWLSYSFRTIQSYSISVLGQTIPLSFPSENTNGKPHIYNVSVSHHFTDNLLGYFTTGSSWRPPYTVLGVQNATDNPALNSLTDIQAEESHSYEFGFKWRFLNRRAQVNVAVFHQYFDGLQFQSAQYTPYLVATPATPNTPASTTITTNQFTMNANSVINGVDLDSEFRVTPRLTVSGAFSYANGHVDGAKTPCTPAGLNLNNLTVASFQAAVAAAGQPGALVYLCNSRQAVSTAPSWNASVQTAYFRPVTDKLDGFVRGLFDYYPSNPNAAYGYDVPSYALVNLYLGVTNPDQGWEITLFAKNLFNRFVLLNKSYFPYSGGAGLDAVFGNPGYYNGIQITPPMEVGLDLHYSFGSR